MLELWPVLFGSVDVSETFGSWSSTIDNSAPAQSTPASLDKRSSSYRDHSSKGATAALACMRPESAPISDPVGTAESGGPDETRRIFWQEKQSELSVPMEERRNPKRLQNTRTRHHDELPSHFDCELGSAKLSGI